MFVLWFNIYWLYFQIFEWHHRPTDLSWAVLETFIDSWYWRKISKHWWRKISFSFHYQISLDTIFSENLKISISCCIWISARTRVLPRPLFYTTTMMGCIKLYLYMCVIFCGFCGCFTLDLASPRSIADLIADDNRLRKVGTNCLILLAVSGQRWIQVFPWDTCPPPHAPKQASLVSPDPYNPT